MTLNRTFCSKYDKVFGSQQIDDLIERAKEAQQAQKRQRQKNRGWER